MLPEYCYSQHDMDAIDGIVIHYFSCINVDHNDPFNPEKCIELFKDLNRPIEERETFKNIGTRSRLYASAHYLIDREGNIHALVPLPKKAWHAGISEWNGKENCNNWMVGIEMIATYESGYTDAQYYALDSLTEQLIANYSISWNNITGHENIAPDRKKDPGPKFDWERYKAMGNQ